MKTTIPDFLLEMSKQINTQDNRITADPVWQVRCKRTRPTASEYSDRFVIFDHEQQEEVADSGSDENINFQISDYLCLEDEDMPAWLDAWICAEGGEFDSQADKREYFLDNYDHVRDGIASEWDVVWIEEYEDVVKGAFLTEADANWFIKRKQHDYPKLYTYVESMCFCPQMIELRKWIMELTK